MSGLAVAIRTDGAPVAADVIERMTAPLALRGPDGCATWSGAQAALGHARLQIGQHSDAQPLTRDGSVWIVADARIDDRRGLVAALGDAPTNPESDAELILRAFSRWGNACVDHLIGDFAFAIWDSRTRRLFCARDHLGVKPLHYSERDGWLLLSSSVDSLRQHSAVSDAIDEFAAADFLLFGHKADPAATTFRDIRRVPPAHTLTWAPGHRCRLRRYWQIPIEEPVHRRDAEYVAELRDVLDRATGDRLRLARAGVFLSGGLDSTIVAARARRYAQVQAFTFAYASLPGDQERTYAAAAAAYLGIPGRAYEMDLSSGWHEAALQLGPEPLLQSIDPVVQTRCLRDVAANSHIALSGEGPDNALAYEWASHVRYLWQAKRYGRLAIDALKFLQHQRRLPHWPSPSRRSPPRPDEQPSMPAWISGDLVHRLGLEERWRFVMRPAGSSHPTRPVAYFSLQLPLWHAVFDGWDPCYTGVALEVSHPFLDIRVLRFLLTVPVVPWCRDKHLLRYAFGGELPAVVRERPKAPLSASPERASIARDGLPPLIRSTRLEAYASLDKVTTTEDTLRLAAFSQWLCRVESVNRAAAPA